ncbi:MAG TPA: hemerythrin domain-containing protein, partial [Rhizomicrobium sp.]
MASEKTQDAIALLKADHRKVEELFEKYESARSKKADLAKQICMELTIHTMIEEEIFYPACREAGVESDMMDEANVEH